MRNLIRKSLKHNILFILYSFLLLISTSSCGDKDVLYSHFYEFKGVEWMQENILSFEIDTALITLNEPYALSIEMSNNPKYPYKNIWISAQHNFKSDSIFSELEKEFQLADESGKWKGDGFGILYQSSFILEENVIFRDKRNHIIKIKHEMKDNPLIGIEKIGIKLSRKKQIQ